MKVTYYIDNQQEKCEFVPEYESLVKSAVEGTLEYEGFDKDCEISVTFTDNENIRELNREYRDIDRETDVLSFPMEDDGDEVVLGDVVISLEKAKEQAEEYGHSIEREISFLCVHSCLHLLGYDHETSEEDEKVMFAKQDEILKNIGQIR
ncbi:MAG: rRNA maturation RNase YbeY [Ruminococcaceae bacterium]|nr:rRNA maturation RNase YbeY [Oscillospiraceae bacterium]